MKPPRVICSLDLDAPVNGFTRKMLCGQRTSNPKDWTGETTCPRCLKVEEESAALDFGQPEQEHA